MEIKDQFATQLQEIKKAKIKAANGGESFVQAPGNFN